METVCLASCRRLDLHACVDGQCPERTEIVNIAIKLAETGEFADAYGPFLASTRAGAPAFGRACAPHC